MAPRGLHSQVKAEETFPSEEFRLRYLWRKERDLVPALFCHYLGTQCRPESGRVMILLISSDSGTDVVGRGKSA